MIYYLVIELEKILAMILVLQTKNVDEFFLENHSLNEIFWDTKNEIYDIYEN